MGEFDESKIEVEFNRQDERSEYMMDSYSFKQGVRYQIQQDQERTAELEQALKDQSSVVQDVMNNNLSLSNIAKEREATIVKLEAELEKFRNWYKLGCKEYLDG